MENLAKGTIDIELEQVQRDHLGNRYCRVGDFDHRNGRKHVFMISKKATAAAKR